MSGLEKLYHQATKILGETAAEVSNAFSPVASLNSNSESSKAASTNPAGDAYTTQANAGVSSIISDASGGIFSQAFSSVYVAEPSEVSGMAEEPSISEFIQNKAESMLRNPDGSFDKQSLGLALGAAVFVGAGAVGLGITVSRRLNLRSQNKAEAAFVAEMTAPFKDLEARLASATGPQRVEIVKNVLDVLVNIFGKNEAYHFINALNYESDKLSYGLFVDGVRAKIADRARQRGISSLGDDSANKIIDALNKIKHPSVLATMDIDPRVIYGNLAEQLNPYLSSEKRHKYEFRAVRGAEAYYLALTPNGSRGNFWRAVTKGQWEMLPEGLRFSHLEGEIGHVMRDFLKKVVTWYVDDLRREDYRDVAVMLQRSPQQLMSDLLGHKELKTSVERDGANEFMGRMFLHAQSLKKCVISLLEGEKTYLSSLGTIMADLGFDLQPYMEAGSDLNDLKTAFVDFAVARLDIFRGDAETGFAEYIAPKIIEMRQIHLAASDFANQTNAQNFAKLLELISGNRDRLEIMSSLVSYNVDFPRALEAEIQEHLGRNFRLGVKDEYALKKLAYQVKVVVYLVEMHHANDTLLEHETPGTSQFIEFLNQGNVRLGAARGFLYDGKYYALPLVDYELKILYDKVLEESPSEYAVLRDFLPKHDRAVISDSQAGTQARERLLTRASSITEDLQNALLMDLRVAVNNNSDRHRDLVRAISALIQVEDVRVLEALSESYQQLQKLVKDRLNEQRGLAGRIQDILPHSDSPVSHQLESVARRLLHEKIRKQLIANPGDIALQDKYFDFLATIMLKESNDGKTMSECKTLVHEAFAYRAPEDGFGLIAYPVAGMDAHMALHDSSMPILIARARAQLGTGYDANKVSPVASTVPYLTIPLRRAPRAIGR